MSEPTLSLKRSDFQAKVGDYLGYGRGVDAGDPTWSKKQAADIEDCLRSGIRQFYYPPILEGEVSSYDWSFLRPLAQLTFTSGSQTMPLPDDFGGIEGQILLVGSSNVPWPIPVSGQVRMQYFNYPDATGQPMMSEVEPIKDLSLATGQRYQLRLWPAADQDYNLQLRYYINPNCLTGNLPYAYGGPPHAETIQESCLAIAEQQRDDTMGVHTQKFMERLAASIGLDRRLNPQFLGYNGDYSDGCGYRRSDRHDWQTGITFSGIQY